MHKKTTGGILILLSLLFITISLPGNGYRNTVTAAVSDESLIDKKSKTPRSLKERNAGLKGLLNLDDVQKYQSNKVFWSGGLPSSDSLFRPGLVNDIKEVPCGPSPISGKWFFTAYKMHEGSKPTELGGGTQIAEVEVTDCGEKITANIYANEEMKDLGEESVGKLVLRRDSKNPNEYVVTEFPSKEYQGVTWRLTFEDKITDWPNTKIGFWDGPMNSFIEGQHLNQRHLWVYEGGEQLRSPKWKKGDDAQKMFAALLAEKDAINYLYAKDVSDVVVPDIIKRVKESTGFLPWTKTQLIGCNCKDKLKSYIDNEIKSAEFQIKIFRETLYKQTPKDWFTKGPCKGVKEITGSKELIPTQKARSCQWNSENYREFTSVIQMEEIYPDYNKALKYMYEYYKWNEKTNEFYFDLPESKIHSKNSSQPGTDQIALTQWKPDCYMDIHDQEVKSSCFPRIARDAALIHEYTHLLQCSTRRSQELPGTYADNEIEAYTQHIKFLKNWEQEHCSFSVY